jgi:hypothetical protein
VVERYELTPPHGLLSHAEEQSHRCRNAALYITAKLIVEWQRCVNNGSYQPARSGREHRSEATSFAVGTRVNLRPAYADRADYVIIDDG